MGAAAELINGKCDFSFLTISPSLSLSLRFKSGASSFPFALLQEPTATPSVMNMNSPS